MQHDKIEESLIQAYKKTNYYVYYDSELIIINIGLKNQKLLKLFKDKKLTSASIITAYNPFSEIKTEEQNSLAQLKLKESIVDSNLSFINAMGKDAQHKWPNEASYFIEDITKIEAKKLGKEFNQNAIVWIGENIMPELVFCFQD